MDYQSRIYLIEKPLSEIEEIIKSSDDKNFYSEPSIFNQQAFINTIASWFIKSENLERKLKKNENMTFGQSDFKIKEQIGENPVDKINQLLEDYEYDKFKICIKFRRGTDYSILSRQTGK